MRIFPINKPLILITMGDPSGIGPEVIMKSMASPGIEGLAIFVLLADKESIERYSAVFKGKIVYYNAEKGIENIDLNEKALNVIDPTVTKTTFVPGKSTPEGARKSLDCIDFAISLAKKAEGSDKVAIVTGPVSKEAVSKVSPGFIGHTEYLQEAFGAKLVSMVLTGEKLNVIPVTRHIPLRDVPNKLTEDLIYRTIEQIIEYRKEISGKPDAKIGVAALNPHSGENGRIGREEGEIIKPAIERAKALYKNVEGPISADVIFYQALKGKFDIVISMYHDQCLAPFKMIDFDTGVNMTVGLGCVRTSPDHGTAFDIAGKGIASPESMIRAIKLAVRAIK